MSLNDPLANALSHIKNCENTAKTKAIIKNSSTLIKEILTLLKENGYIEKFTEVKTTRGNILEVSLIGKINNCGAIKPRFSVTLGDYEKFEKRYLPAKGFGIILVSTNQGILVHSQAREKNLGGRLLAYCY
jgi:small subunit ribosomal protein S8